MNKKNLAYSAFSKDETLQIKRALDLDIVLRTKLVHFLQYELMHNGSTPRSKTNSFETQSLPISSITEGVELQSNFFKTLCQDHPGVASHYDNLVGSDWIDRDLIGTLAMKLTFEIGLFASSILSLKSNCFCEYDFQNNGPTLEYPLIRNGTEKKVINTSLDLMQPVYNVNNIRSIIDFTCVLTARIRQKAPENIKDFLFIYQHPNSSSNGDIVMKLNDHTMFTVCKRFRSNYNLLNDNGKPLKLNLTRFRATKIVAWFQGSKSV